MDGIGGVYLLFEIKIIWVKENKLLVVREKIIINYIFIIFELFHKH